MVQISEKPKESTTEFFNSILSNLNDNVYEGNSTKLVPKSSLPIKNNHNNFRVKSVRNRKNCSSGKNKSATKVARVVAREFQ